jgi:hypothetical protein
MIKPKRLRHIAVCGVTLPTFAVSPGVAKATVYMSSQVAARVLGRRPAKNVGKPMVSQLAEHEQQTST